MKEDFKFNNKVLSAEDKRKERLLRDIAEVKKVMQEIYGIDNLSDIEGVRLREIVQRVEQELDESRSEEAGKFSNGKEIDLTADVISTWLLELYEININDVKWRTTLTDAKTGEVKYKNLSNSEYEKKRDELALSTRAYGVESKVDEEYKEYLRKVREEAHLL